MKTVEWFDGRVKMIDQTMLPETEEFLYFDNYLDVANSIKTMKVRGAPAIGVTAALGLALAAHRSTAATTAETIKELNRAAEILGATRPTAVNLFWAISRMMSVANAARDQNLADFRELLVAEAVNIQEEDIRRNQLLSDFGSSLINDGDSVLTHCNAGALACAGCGTAVGVITAAWEQGKNIHVYVDETRPRLQGAKLTAWELTRAGVPMTLITDSMAGHFMQQGQIQKVVVGADRIAGNGDTANKIGTYSVAVLAKAHNIPFYVAAPTSTIDLNIAAGEDIPIEERQADEITMVGSTRLAPHGVRVANPAFDVTPNRLVTAIVTEVGVSQAPFNKTLARAVGSRNSAVGLRLT